jgi:hypothetical protein
MEVEGRLDKLEGHAVSTEHRLGNLSAEIKGLGTIVSSQGAKLDQIIIAVTTNDAANKARPQFDFAKTLSIVKDLAYLVGGVGVLSIWLIVTLTAAEDRVQSAQYAFLVQRIDAIVKRLDRTDDRFGWSPKLEGNGSSKQ